MTWQAPESEEAWAECLSAYADGEMSSDDKTELENILKSDPKRATQLEDLKKTSKLLRKWNIEAPVPDADFIREVRKQYKPAGRRLLPVRWRVWPVAASAVLAFLLIIFWHVGSPGDISWADVREHLEQVRTMTGTSNAYISMADGEKWCERSKFYSKDPGLSRTETYVQKSDLSYGKPGSEWVVISRRKPGKLEMLTLPPDSKPEERATNIRLVNVLAPFNDVVDAWMQLKSIMADNTKYIGDWVIDGKSVSGFETRLQIPDSPNTANGAIPKGRITVWASRDDAVPLYLEIEYWGAQGRNVHVECSDIQWNIPLEDNLFDFTTPVGWDLHRTRVELTKYTGTGLAPGVTLEISPDGEKPLAVAGDVAGVIQLIKQTTRLDSNIPETMQITIDLKPEAARRLHEYANAHPKKIITVNFNGQTNVAAKLDAIHPTQINFDLVWLRLSMAELETKYFTTAIERNKNDHL